MTDPAAKYLRRITIRDTLADAGERRPVHVSHVMLFDDVERPGLVFMNDSWEACGGSVEGSLVSFTVDASRAHIGSIIDGRLDDFRLDDMPVLVPADAEWEVFDVDPLGGPSKVRVQIFVREFAFLAAAPAVGDRVTDGGIVGDGLLHQPEPGAMPQSVAPQNEVSV